MKTKKLPNIHAGEILLEEFLLPMNVSENALARHRRATGAHQRNRARQTWRYRQYRTMPRGCFWDQ